MVTEIFLVAGIVSLVVGLLLLISGYILYYKVTLKRKPEDRKAICTNMIYWGWLLFGIGIGFALGFGVLPFVLLQLGVIS